MINNRILTQTFEYFTPTTVEETLRLLDQYGQEAKIMAGGTDILVQLKQEILSPNYLIHIRKIPELSYIKNDGTVRIGAVTRLCEVLQFFMEDGKYSALYEALRSLGDVQIRNMGTIGGNLCNASPAADSALPLLVFDGRVKLSSVRGERIINLEDFFKGVNRTAMAPNEIMMEIQIPSIKEGTGSVFKKIKRVGADISKISCAVAVERREDVCVSCRIALGAVAPVPMRAKEAEGALVDKRIDDSFVEEIGLVVSEEINPITDIRSTAAYRRQIAAVLFKDVFRKAWQRAGGEEE